jgi:pyruvate/2-oxoglutarate dehydrogenase complex dihydrolipoamide dehydrogenase (E3) component
VLVSTVELYWRARSGGRLGLKNADRVALDWSAVIERKDRIVASWSQDKEEGLAKLGISVVRGAGKFAGPREIAVEGKKLSAKKFIIATGSKPARPAIPGAERCITSDELIHLKQQPRELVVIGGGFIGLEFGFALARAGSKVTILQAGPEIAPALDDDIRKALLEIAEKAGIAIVTNATVKKIEDDKTVAADVAGKSQRIAADQVLLAVGRPSNVAALEPEKAGIELDHSAVKVNPYLQSVTNPRIYAAGDAAGKHQHTPVAWYEGALAAQNAVKGNRRKIDFRVFPSAVFTIPAIGQVGLTEKQARDTRASIKVSRTPLSSNPEAGVRDETEGLVKVVYAAKSGRILGVHCIGAGAEEIIQIASAGMLGGLTKSAFASAHYVFPTLGGAIVDAMAAGS